MRAQLRVLALWIVIVVAAPAVRAADLDELRARGVLRHLGVPYANFVSGAGDGMDVELIQAFAQSLGVKYEFVKADWGTVIPDLIGRKVKVVNGRGELQAQVPVKGDLIANGFTVLPWRQTVVEFSKPTFPSQIWLVARSDSPLRPIEPAPDVQEDIARTRALMKGRTVLTVEKTCLDASLYDLGSAGAKVVVFKGNLNDVAPALVEGEADLTILDVPDALVALEKWHSRIKILGPVSAPQTMATAFPKDAPKLLNGTYLRLVKKYYPTAAGYFPGFFEGMH
jgi:ABC-type amino acid transport substrate-binding protein